MLLVELNRDQILAQVDPRFIHHFEHTKELPDMNHSGVVYQNVDLIKVLNKQEIKTNWLTNSATFPGEKEHTQMVVVMGLMDKLKKKKYDVKRLGQDVLDSLQNGDLKINCSCEAFLYWGYKYISTRKGIIVPGEEEHRAPDIRNEHQKGICCKHLAFILKRLGANSMKITSHIKTEILPTINKSIKLKEEISLEDRIKIYLKD